MMNKMFFSRRSLGVIFIVSFILCTSNIFAEEAPRVTRWMHPDGILKPTHEPLQIVEPFNVSVIQPHQHPGYLPPPSLEGRICLVVDSSVYGAISTSLTQYQHNLAGMGFSTITVEYLSGPPEDLRTLLYTLYNEPESLVGAVLIGDIPYIIYELIQNWGSGPEYEDFPCDIFYMDLNGQWSDILNDPPVEPNNDKYDTRSGDLDLEIWVSRIKTDNLTTLGSEIDILNSYFDKNHRYRLGSLVPDMKGLVYVDDDWESMGTGDRDMLEDIYGTGNVTAVWGPESTTALDYKTNRMTEVFEMVTTRSHGYPGGHGYYENNRTEFNYVFTSDYTTLDPISFFYSLFVCSGCDYTANNYLGGIIAFNTDDSGLVSWGSTKTGGMWADSLFYQSLAENSCVGDAFIDWFNYVQSIYPSYAPRWWYGMVILGDGAAFVNTSMNPYGDDLAVDFGTNGLWHYDGSWSRMTTWNPDDGLTGWSGGLGVDFGGSGLWNHNGSSWSRLTTWNAGSAGMTGWNSGLAVDFDANGLWNFNGSAWNKLTNWDADDDLTGWSGGLAVDFDGSGLWINDGSSWSRITTWDAGSAGLADWSEGLAADFDGNGLWSYDGSAWRKLTNWDAEDAMTGWNDGLAVDFGPNGLWSYDGSTWHKLTSWDASVMTGLVDGLAVDFNANDMWKYDGSSWSKVTNWNPENMSDCDLN